MALTLKSDIYVSLCSVFVDLPSSQKIKPFPSYYLSIVYNITHTHSLLKCLTYYFFSFLLRYKLQTIKVTHYVVLTTVYNNNCILNNT